MNQREVSIDIKTTGPADQYLRVTVRHQRGEYVLCVVPITKLPDTGTGFSGIRCSIFDMESRTIEPAPRFNAKRLAEIASTIKDNAAYRLVHTVTAKHNITLAE